MAFEESGNVQNWERFRFRTLDENSVFQMSNHLKSLRNNLFSFAPPLSSGPLSFPRVEPVKFVRVLGKRLRHQEGENERRLARNFDWLRVHFDLETS